jgi:hypothetical protein
MVPAFDLALCLRIARGAAQTPHLSRFDVFSQLTCDLTGAVVRQQP